MLPAANGVHRRAGEAKGQAILDELDKLLGPDHANADGDWMIPPPGGPARGDANLDWGRVQEILSSTSPSTWGRGRLHAIIRKDGPAEIVVSLITKCPNIARENHGGTYPLHEALRVAAGRRVSTVGTGHWKKRIKQPPRIPFVSANVRLAGCLDETVVLALIEACPDAIRTRDRTGWLPIHLAIRYAASLEVVSALITAFPGGVKERNSDNWLPLHLAARNLLPREIMSILIATWPGAARKRTPLGSLPLHLAVGNSAPAKVVSMLIIAWPGAAKERNAKGWLPLHVAVRYSAPLRVVAALIRAWPDAVRENISDRGMFPMQLVQAGPLCYRVACMLAWHGSPLQTDNAEVKDALKKYAAEVVNDLAAFNEFEAIVRLHGFGGTLGLRGHDCVGVVRCFLLPSETTLRGLSMLV